MHDRCSLHHYVLKTRMTSCNIHFGWRMKEKEGGRQKEKDKWKEEWRRVKAHLIIIPLYRFIFMGFTKYGKKSSDIFQLDSVIAQPIHKWHVITTYGLALKKLEKKCACGTFTSFFGERWKKERQSPFNDNRVTWKGTKYIRKVYLIKPCSSKYRKRWNDHRKGT